MPVFEWRERTNAHLGKLYYPIAKISLLANDGQYHAISLMVDSGATVSLLRRSIGELLGLRFESGIHLK